MPSVAVKLYSVFFKLLLKRRLHSLLHSPSSSLFGLTSRPDDSSTPASPSFGSDSVATKDIHIDPLTSLSIRIFLPDPSSTAVPHHQDLSHLRRTSYSGAHLAAASPSIDQPRRSSYGSPTDPCAYSGYLPTDDAWRRPGSRKLPVMLQFHGGAFVSGSNTSPANDLFCRRIARLCDVIVIAVGYRLAPESRYPAAFEDGLKVLNWLAKQANLAECSKSMGNLRSGDARRADGQRYIVDTFGASTVEPWLAAHGDPSRCVLLGVSCGANIADYVARKAVEAKNLLDPVKVVAQVLMYPFFIGSVPTHSEIKLTNSYFYDKSMCLLAWRLFLPEYEFDLDHPAANPLVPGRGPPLKCMPPTLTVVAEHDWMRDRAIAYSEELRKVNLDSPVLEYKDSVHEFATLDMLLTSPQAQACADDIAIWVKKYISQRGHEFSY
ncbi:probable carboxylesterase 16 [Dioscorea cayenensis subsp. rotundata]|uniref:Probable carboxylesterase 16 n=1 Tax=Dioscorea cayennensis subsp. rotundata TaxID=55577 RepID=A0AB40B0R4_DIOCR|nr:probable carboxylesterase 16 [Dioscorea cayenensis subsp. rotundata]